MNVPHIDQMNAGGGLPLLSVRRLRVEFPSRRGTLLALDDVSFDIARGEVLGVVGESGAGKSLTARPSSAFWSRPGASPAARSCSTASASTRCASRSCAACAGGASR